MMHAMERVSPILKLFSVVVLICLWDSGGAVWAQAPDNAFEEAENTFRYQDYRRAVQLYEALLVSGANTTDPERMLIIREHLGASRWFLKEWSGAEKEFTALLLAAPTVQLNSFYYPPELVVFFNNLRDRLLGQGVLKLEPEKEPVKTEDKPPVVAVKTIETVTIEKNPLITAFIPFGVGQFQNGDTAAGIGFLASETVALASTIATYFLILENRSNPDVARDYEIAFWVSEGIFVGLVAAGIIEAVVNHRAQSPPTIERRTVVDPDAPVTNAQPSVRPILGVGNDSEFFLGFSRSF
ncbi:MAG: hypothetical protein HUU55_07330 [Myxococcales bacterium]|nr:hypothetical protein [Myxococcales bacterium]